MQNITHHVKANGIATVYQKYGLIIQQQKNLAHLMEQDHILVDKMIFCLSVEAIILLWIVLDLVKLTKKKRSKYFNFLEIVLTGMFVLLFIYVILNGKELEILSWINNNSQFYLIYLLSALIWVMLNCILYYRK